MFGVQGPKPPEAPRFWEFQDTGKACFFMKKFTYFVSINSSKMLRVQGAKKCVFFSQNSNFDYKYLYSSVPNFPDNLVPPPPPPLHTPLRKALVAFSVAFSSHSPFISSHILFSLFFSFLLFFPFILSFHFSSFPFFSFPLFSPSFLLFFFFLFHSIFPLPPKFPHNLRSPALPDGYATLCVAIQLGAARLSGPRAKP